SQITFVSVSKLCIRFFGQVGVSLFFRWAPRINAFIEWRAKCGPICAHRWQCTALGIANRRHSIECTCKHLALSLCTLSGAICQNVKCCTLSALSILIAQLCSTLCSQFL